ncbi:hypothetical protein [Klebsiella pneumoniae]|uniref:hypothetical protein n=1 Tax=Klebsiella pneumoniae TaxID=573 RepID=UPI00210BC058|nr:hypothetical protein [Klebsiella pneumoniae]
MWAGEVPGHSKAAEPVKIFLKESTKLVRQNQYPSKLEARRGLEKMIENFLKKYRLLVECESEFNTPILPVKKPESEEYRLVQDFNSNKFNSSRYSPLSGKPVSLLTALKENHKWFTVLNL